MPRVPVQELPTVAQAPLGAPQSNIDARGTFGEPMAQALAQVGQAAQHVEQVGLRLVQQEREKAARTEATAAEAEFGTFLNGALYDKKAGFYTLKGVNAIGASDPLLQGVAKKRQEIEDKISSGAAREVFRQRTQGLSESTYRQVNEYVIHQGDAVADETDKAADALSLERTARGYDKPDVVADEMANVASRARDWAQRYGLEAPATAARVEAAERRQADVVVRGFIGAGDNEGARKALEAFRDKLGTQSDDLADAIDRMDVRVGAEKAAKAAATAHSSDVTLPDGSPIGRLDGNAIMRQIDEMPADTQTQARTKAAASTEAQQRIAGSEQRWELAGRNVYREAASQYDAANSLSGIHPVTEAFLRKHQPDLWQHLEDRAHMDAAHWRQRREERGDSAAQREAYWRLMQRMTDDQPAYLPMSIAEFRADAARFGVGAHGLEQASAALLQMQGRSDRKDPAAPLPTSVLSSLIVEGKDSGALPARFRPSDPKMLGKTTPAGVAAGEWLASSQAELQARRNLTIEQTGTPPTPAQWSGWIKELATKGTIETVPAEERTWPASYWGPKTAEGTAMEATILERPFKARAEAPPAAPGVPPADARKIAESLRRAGKPVTPGAIRDVYLDFELPKVQKEKAIEVPALPRPKVGEPGGPPRLVPREGR